MPGELDLQTLLRTMTPVLDDEAYAFISVSADVLEVRRPKGIGLFHEDEGATLIVPPPEAERLGAAPGPLWARITLSVHSSLTAVGFIARVATALAAAGISVNPVSGYYHDHLFVPWPERHHAMAVLRSLAGGDVPENPDGGLR